MNHAVANKRANVTGQGPGRQWLPSYHYLGPVDPLVMTLANEEIESFIAAERETDCCTDIYPVSHGNPLNDLFGPHYKQMLLQLAENEGLLERDYVVPRNALAERLLTWLDRMHLFRARLARLRPGGVADWHIDTNTSVACRVQFLIRGESTWSIKRSGSVETQRMVAGETWFANTGWAHRIDNYGTEDRWVLIAGCDYNELARQFGAFKLAEAHR
jgi:quercetin dioxygenase-like cupin family protein